MTLLDRLAARGVPVLGPCDACGVPVVRTGWPPHGGAATHDHGWLYHADGWLGGGRHSPVLAGIPDFVPGPRCALPGHDH